MITFFEITAFVMILVLSYIYIGYPLLLVLLRFMLPEKKVDSKDIFPEVSLLISCFNEASVIREKLDNSLALDYPQDKLEILVISDASTDGTDDIVREYADRGIRLIRQSENLGKTLGLNLAVPQARGEVIVFSDANAIYRSDAISKLVRNFNDDKVGYVVGEARYRDITQTAASMSETTYWKFEIMIKKMESYIHSVVGGDGAIYAIRRELYERLLSTDINDFVNPLQIISKGYRGVFESEAICTEESAGDFSKEFQRKVRIINRSFSGLMRIKEVMNPFRTGCFSIGVISHKLLRWFAPFFLIILMLSCFALSLGHIGAFHWLALILSMFFMLAYVGYVFSERYNLSQVFYYPYYFTLVSIASLIGLYRSLRGEVQTTWNTIRSVDEEKQNVTWTGKIVHICLFIVVWFFIRTAGELAGMDLLSNRVIYWTFIFLIIYVYAGYPLVLSLMSHYSGKPLQYGEVFPDVTLLVCAYNEEEVIRDKIINSLELDYPATKLTIAIASDGSTDRTNEIVREFEDGRLVLMDYPERRGKVTVINDSVPKIQSEIIVFSDANTMYQKDSIKKLVRNFNDPSIGGVSADVILHSEETTYGRSESLYYLYERWIQSKESEVGSIIGADGGMYAIRRSLFVPPSPNIILDDFVISMNVALNGHRLVYEREALGHEHSSSSPKVEFLRKSRVVAGAVQSVLQNEGVPSSENKSLLFCYISHKFLRWMIPVFLLILFAANTSIYLSPYGGGIYSCTLFVQVLFYLLAVSDVFISKKHKLPFTSIPYYFCLVNGAALYGIYKGILNKQPVTWRKFRRDGEN